MHLKQFFCQRRGTLIQAFIALAIMGFLSFQFWSNWEDSVRTAGAQIKARLETNDWLSTQ